VTSPLFWGSELFCGVTQNGWWWIRVQLGLTAPPPPLDGDSLKLTPWCCHKHWRAFSAHLLSPPSIQRDRSSCPQLLCLPLDSIFLCHTVLGWHNVRLLDQYPVVRSPKPPLHWPNSPSQSPNIKSFISCLNSHTLLFKYCNSFNLPKIYCTCQRSVCLKEIMKFM